VQNFRNLGVWTKAHELTLEVYSATRQFPKEEVYGLRDQLRTSSASIPMNIAEGCCRDGDREFARFLYFAMGSASELDYQLLLARDLGFLGDPGYSDLSNRTIEVKKMISSLLRKLRADS
jgi:four helix bundle protein